MGILGNRYDGETLTPQEAGARALVKMASRVPEGVQVPEHMHKTPERFLSMLQELTTPEPFEFTVFDNEGVDEMVVIQDIPFYTLCAHHMIPFFGKAHIAYIPGSKIAGLSKFARTVKYFCKGLNVQEELTKNIHDFLTNRLIDPLGVGVIMKGEHLCMTMRGVQTPGTFTTTSAMSGAFRDPSELARTEFLNLIGTTC